MVSFYRFETADLTLKFTPKGILNDYNKIVVSVSQKDVAQIDKTEDDLEIDTSNDTITLSLSQQETGQFKPRLAEIQVNIYYNDEQRNVSTKASIDVYDNLYEKVITNE